MPDIFKSIEEKDELSIILSLPFQYNRRNRMGLTVLHHLQYKKLDHLIPLSLSYGANIDAMDMYGNTILHFSVYSADIDQMNKILSWGADINTQTSSGYSILHVALLREEVSIEFFQQILKIGLENGIDIDVKDKDLSTSLILAAEKQRKDLVDILLKSGANPTIRNIYENTYLDILK